MYVYIFAILIPFLATNIIIIIASGFSGGSVVKNPLANARDAGLTPGLGRSPGEGIDYPLQYSWASLVAQLVKNPLQCRRPGFDPWIGKIP